MIQVARNSQFARILREQLGGVDAVRGDGSKITIAATGHTLTGWTVSDSKYLYQCASVIMDDGAIVPVVYHVREIGVSNVDDNKNADVMHSLATMRPDANKKALHAAIAHYAARLRAALTDSVLTHIGQHLFRYGDTVTITASGRAPAGDGYELLGRSLNHKDVSVYVRKDNTIYPVYLAERLVNTSRPVPDKLDTRLDSIAAAKIITDKGLLRPVPMEYIAAMYGLTSVNDKEGGEDASGTDQTASGTDDNGASTGRTRSNAGRTRKTNEARQLATKVQNGNGLYL